MLFRSVFKRISPQKDERKKAAGEKIFLLAFAFVFAGLFIYLPIFAGLRSVLEDRDIYIKYLTPPKKIVVEIIDGIPVRPGVIDKLQNLEETILQEAVYDANERIKIAIDRAHDKMAENADLFLDWYYSLPAEYGRLVTTISGKADDYLTEKLTQYLQTGNPGKQLNEAVEALRVKNRKRFERFRAEVSKILEENRVDLGAYDRVIESQKSSLNQILFEVDRLEDKIDFETRSMISGGGGTVGFAAGAMITKKVTAKITGKSAFKAAVKAIGKLAGKKAAGAAAGGVIGAAAGSVFPIFGTAAGAAVGGTLGALIVGVSIDKLILELEETVNREEFKNEIIDAINENRKSMKEQIG